MPQFALSIKQPWVELILRGRKTIETRNWRPPVRGPIWLHASKAVDQNAVQRFGFAPETLPLGCLVGTATLYDVRRYEDGLEFAADYGRHLVDTGTHLWVSFGLILRDVSRITPVPCRGKLGFFEPEQEVVSQLSLLSTQHSGL